ncbi:very short patch repair endonuclease [Pseudoxanthomonas sp. z9]|uniref:very short patch repair endonuclease n=1 Tax=Pseudoxanthomonas sp. z9 TaxID=2584942 RepID=UPI0015E8A64D|nr:very short patch repair endonuclease [Pseudoxanthomonas sp. z9]
MIDVVAPEIRSRMMASIRGRNTRPEMQVRRHLHALGFRYRLHRKDLPGKPDMVLPRHQMVIFVHGCFWHGHRGCRFATIPATRTEFWTVKISTNQARDAAAEFKLRQAGWRIATVWECALRTSPDEAMRRLVNFIISSEQSLEVAA